MKFARFAALLAFVSFAVAVPTAKAPSELVARSNVEARDFASVHGVAVAKREPETQLLEVRQLDSLLALLQPIITLVNGLPLVGPIVGSLLQAVLSLLGSTVPPRELQSGAKTLVDVSTETGVPVEDLTDIFSAFPTGTIPGITHKAKREIINVEARQLDSLLALLQPVINLINGLPLVGPIVGGLLQTLLSLLGSTVPPRELQSGAKTLVDVSKETGVSVEDLTEIFSVFPSGTIPGVTHKAKRELINVEARQLDSLLALLQPVINLINGLPLVGPIVGGLLQTLLGLLGSTVPPRELQSGAKTLEDVSKETGISVDDLEEIFAVFPSGTIPGVAGKGKRELINVEARQLDSLLALLQPVITLINGLPLVGPIVGGLLQTILSLLGSTVPPRELQSGAKTLADVSKETGVSLEELTDIFSVFPSGTIPGVTHKGKRELIHVEDRQLDTILALLQPIITLLNGLPLVGPIAAGLLQAVLALLGSTVPARDLQTGAKTLQDVSSDSGISVDDLKDIFSKFPAGFVPGI